jgi:hypothetical protein
MALGDLFGTGTESFMRVQVVLLLLAAGWTFGPLAPEPLVLVSTIELPNVDGRIDHLACDVATGRIFVAALGNNTVEVVAPAGTYGRLAGSTNRKVSPSPPTPMWLPWPMVPPAMSP